MNITDQKVATKLALSLSSTYTSFKETLHLPGIRTTSYLARYRQMRGSDQIGWGTEPRLLRLGVGDKREEAGPTWQTGNRVYLVKWEWGVIWPGTNRMRGKSKTYLLLYGQEMGKVRSNREERLVHTWSFNAEGWGIRGRGVCDFGPQPDQVKSGGRWIRTGP